MDSTPCPNQSTPLATHRYTAASVIDTASKYKMLWRLPLEDADIIKGERLESVRKILVLGSSSQKSFSVSSAWRLSVCLSSSFPAFVPCSSSYMRGWF